MAYKILMIDDDAELLKMLRRYFEMKNYEVITAENGAEGFNKIGLEPDIILLDVNMPRIDGIEVCQRIRDKVSCPILFLTAMYSSINCFVLCVITVVFPEPGPAKTIQAPSK